MTWRIRIRSTPSLPNTSSVSTPSSGAPDVEHVDDVVAIRAARAGRAHDHVSAVPWPSIVSVQSGLVERLEAVDDDEVVRRAGVARGSWRAAASGRTGRGRTAARRGRRRCRSGCSAQEIKDAAERAAEDDGATEQVVGAAAAVEVAVDHDRAARDDLVVERQDEPVSGPQLDVGPGPDAAAQLRGREGEVAARMTIRGAPSPTMVNAAARSSRFSASISADTIAPSRTLMRTNPVNDVAPTTTSAPAASVTFTKPSASK